jgi:hypothetical protein
MGRFDRAANGAITVRGRTGAGAWERTIQVSLPAIEAKHDVVKTLWARAKVDEILLPRMAQVESQTLDAATKRAVVRLGESYSIATPFTSFVAVEKSRVVVGGKPMLVAVPVELPDGTNWAGFFGEGVQPAQVVAGEESSQSLHFGAADRAEKVSATGSATFTTAVPPATLPANSAAAPPADASIKAKDGKPQGPPSAAAGRRMPGSPMGESKREILAKSVLRDTGRPGAPAGGQAGGLSGGFGGGGGGSGAAPAPASAAPVVQSESLVRAMESADAVFANDDKDEAAKQDASKSAAPVLSEAERDQLVRRLDRRLVMLALAHLLGQGDAIAKLADELGIAVDNGMVLVAMKAEISGKTKDSITGLGAQIVAEESSRNLLIARIPVAQLAKLAAIDGIKRVEPLPPA